MQDELLVRLKKKSAHTKIKVLKILKYLVERGHESFTKDLQRRTEEVRECLSFRGPPDAMHGEAFNQQVRTSAEELMDTMFESREVIARVTAPSVTASSGIASQGLGANYVESGTYSPSTGRKMVGFGSTPLQPEKEKLGDRIKRGVIDAASKTKEKARGVVHKYKEHLPESMQDKIDEKFPEQRPGVVAGEMGPRSIGGYGSNAGGYTSASSGTFGSGGIGSSGSSSSGGGGGGGGGYSGYSGPGGDAASSGWARSGSNGGTPAVPSELPFVTDPAYVARIVEEISMPAGVRVAPPKDVLAEFVTRCTSLDCHQVAEQLHVKLGAGESDKTRLRSMHVVLALVKSDIPGIASCFASVTGRLQELAGTGNASTKAMANKIMTAVAANVSNPPTPQRASAPLSVGSSSGLIDLSPSDGGSATSGMFGGMQMGPTSGTPATAPASAPALGDGSGGGGMFGGMQMGPSSTAAASAAPLSNDLLGLGSLLGPSTTAGPAVTAAAAPSTVATGDLLGGLGSLSLAPAPTSAPITIPGPTLSPTLSLAPSSASMPAPAPAAPAPAASSFSFIGNATAPATTAQAAAHGSAFSFMQAAAPAPVSSFNFMQPAMTPAAPTVATGIGVGVGVGMGTGTGVLLGGSNIPVPTAQRVAAAAPEGSGGDPFSFIKSEVAANKK